jgi:hypothetical protein
MYAHCIFCSTDLGSNESIEAFPVGTRLAFDAARGRLWAVCGRCARWNLAPIEERWEAIEAAERLFHDARLRAQSENVGMAKLPDGTRLIRVGEALPGELAIWRYGDQLLRRRWRHWAGIAVAAGGGAMAGGLPFLAYLGIYAGALVATEGAFRLMRIPGTIRSRAVVYRVPAAESPTGEPIPIRGRNLRGLRLHADLESGGLVATLPEVIPTRLERVAAGEAESSASPLVLRGEAARAVLGRGMVNFNARGASRRTLGDAVRLLEQAGTADGFLRGFTGVAPYSAPEGWREGGLLFKKSWFSDGYDAEWLDGGNRLRGTAAPEVSLALEMALHEQTERRAMEGELKMLEAAWRDAEEIAAIADALPDDPLHRIRR